MKVSSIIPYAIIASTLTHAETSFLDFSQLSQQNPNASRWQYAGKNEACSDWSSDQGKWCRDDGWWFFWYYNPYQTEHMGFTRFGHLLTDSPYSNSKNDILLVGTGGAYRDINNNIQMSGTQIRDEETLTEALRSPRPEHFSQPVPGAITLYYKHPDPLRAIPEFQRKTNRLRMTVWMPEDADSQTRYRRSDRTVSTAKQQISLYPFINSGKSGHYYHNAMNRGYGQWITIQFDSHPTHHNQPTQPPLGAYKEGGFDYPANGTAYFAAMTSFSLVFYNAKNQANPYMMMMGPWMSDYSPYENEETINNLAIGLDPKKKQFDVSFEDKYRCKDCIGVYEIRYSFSPITNENWNHASRVVSVENFFVEDDNAMQRLIKPSPYYNQVWGKFSITPDDFKNFTVPGKSLYVAVRDLSERKFAYDPDDDTFVPSSSDGLRIPKRSLIKTIRYDFKESPRMPVTENKTMTLFKEDTQVIQPQVPQTVVRGTYPPQLPSEMQFNALTDGYEIKTGTLKESGQGYFYGLDESSWLSYWSRVSAQVVDRDCLDGMTCNHVRLAEFSSSGAQFHVPLWDRVTMDSSSGFREGGAGLILGTNGASQYVLLRGRTLKMTPVDAIEISITNTATYSISTPIYYSTSVQESRTSLNALNWNMLPSKTIPPKTTVNYYIKSSDIAGTLPILNVNIPHPGLGLVIRSVALRTQNADLELF